ncbi:MAG: GNAT family N-acetyltransferase, partial [Chloroflexi bacterium]
EIDLLLARAYGPSDPAPADSPQPLHDPELNARSFLLRVAGRLVSYAGVVHFPLVHAGCTFSAAGLSSVATDPAEQRRGYAQRVVRAASAYIADSGVDLGIFTCAPHLVAFYQEAGGWQPAPAVSLIGNSAPGALASNTLGVVVLLRLFSPRARAAADALSHGVIDLNFPPGRFI